MDQNPQQKNTPFLSRVGAHCAGAITPVALSATSAWLIVTGLKGLAGFTVNRQSALADLIGIILIVAVARWMQLRRDDR